MTDHQSVREQICDIGRRIYQRQFAAANDGNITARVGENEFLCTPTLHCKGFLEPDDLVLIDLQGNQLAGRKKRSSEALLHLEIYKRRPDIQSVVHCHPPHATAFAIAREPLPPCVLPEVEVFLGEVPLTRYETPGTQAFAETILPFVDQSNVMILANHGTVSYGDTVEHAYWWTEILDSYCRMLILAKQLGHVSYLPEDKARELIEIKKLWGFSDPRSSSAYQSADLYANPVYRHTWADAGVVRQAFPQIMPPAANAATAGENANANAAAFGGDDEALIRRIAAEVVRQLKQSASG